MKRLWIAIFILFAMAGNLWGADVKISELTAATAVTSDDLYLITDDPGGTPVSKKVTAANASVGSLLSNATTGVMQVVGPAAGSTRVMTVPDANFTPTWKSGDLTAEHLAVFDGTAGGIKDGGVKVTYTGEKLATFAWDGGGSAVATASSKRCTILPFAATVTKVFAIADASTTTHIHVYQDAFATGARSTTVTGAVDIGATLGSTDTTLTGWDKSITAEDEICMSVEANDNAKWIHVIVFGTR